MKKFTLIPLVLTLTACSGMTTIQNENSSEKKVPKWFLDHPDTEKSMWDKEMTYYAAAEDVSPSLEMAVKKATLKAKAKIADRIVGEMNNQTNITYNEIGDPRNQVGKGNARDVIINNINESVLRTYATDRVMITYNPEQNNYRAFVMLKITKTEAQALAERYDQSHATRHE